MSSTWRVSSYLYQTRRHHIDTGILGHQIISHLYRLLADEEVKEFFHELAMARMAGKKAVLSGFLQSKGRLKKFQTAFNPSING